MRNKFVIIGVLSLFLISLQVSVSASQTKTFYIDGDGIKKIGTYSVSATGAQIIFTKGGISLPIFDAGTSNATVFSITNGSLDDGGMPTGKSVQIDCNVNDVCKVVIWQGQVETLGSYYGSSTLTMTQPNLDDLALTWNWNNLDLAYKADAPYQPVITQVQETSTFKYDGSPTVSTVTINSAAGTGPDGLRPATAYAWKMWVPADPNTPGADVPTTIKATTQNLSVPAAEVTAGTTYAFTVQYTNSWGDSLWSNIKTHTVAGGGPGGEAAGPITYNLRAAAEAMVGLNAVSVMHNVPFQISGNSKTTVATTVANLTDAVNSVADANVVTAVGKMVNGQVEGVYVTYDTNGNAVYTKAGLPDAENTLLVRGESWQISVSENVDVTFTQ